MTATVDMSYLKKRKWSPDYSWGKDLMDKAISSIIWLIRGLIVVAAIIYLI